nr:hypothetical protein [uncultured Allomuricauda sp.]
MKTGRKHIWLSSLLASILLFQWGFGAIHVFTSHTEFHTHNKVDNSDDAVYGVDYECELCAKLNTKPSTLFFTPEIAFVITKNYQLITSDDSVIYTPLLGLNLLRGPPHTI